MMADAILHSQIEQFAEAGADAISIHVENADVAGAPAYAVEQALEGVTLDQMVPPPLFPPRPQPVFAIETTAP